MKLNWVGCATDNRTDVRIFEAIIDWVRLTVIYGHYCYPKKWAVYCNHGIIDLVALEAQNETDAKTEAVKLLEDRFHLVLQAFLNSN